MARNPMIPYRPNEHERHVVEFFKVTRVTSNERIDLSDMLESKKCAICGSYKETDLCIRTIYF